MALRTPGNAKRNVYPLDITSLTELLKAAKRKTKIKNTAELLRLSIERGLPILEQQLASHQPEAGK